MNTTTKRHRVRRGMYTGQKKTVTVKPTKERHVQRDAEKRNEFPKRPKPTTHPFETTLDF